MKKMNAEEMRQTNGGIDWVAVGCVAGATATMSQAPAGSTEGLILFTLFLQANPWCDAYVAY